MNKKIIILSKQINNLAQQAKKEKKLSGLAIITSNQKSNDSFVILPVRKNPLINCVAITIHKLNSLSDILNAVDGKVDFVIIDGEQKVKGMESLVTKSFSKIRKSQIMTYKGNDHTADATESLINELLSPLPTKIISVIGTGNLGTKVALRLAERGNIVYLSGRNIKKSQKIVKALNLLKSKGCRGKIFANYSSVIPKHCDVLIVFTPSVPVVTARMVEKMNDGGLVIDGGIGTIYQEAIKKAREKGISLIRLDARAGFSAAVTLAIETKKLAKQQIGKKILFKNTLVSGGWIGERGDIVVDSIMNPKQIIGIADGKGGIIRLISEFSRRNLKKIQILNNNRLNQTQQIGLY